MNACRQRRAARLRGPCMLGLRMGVLLAMLGAASTTLSAAPAGQPSQVYAVVNVDVDPAQVQAALPALHAFARSAQADAGLIELRVLQRMPGANHFTLLEVFPSMQAYEHFVSSAYAKQLRAALQPLLAGPLDERISGQLPD